jgi:multidrug efflux pump
VTLPGLSVRRPVLATVAALLLAVLGAASIFRLPVREYPDVDPPIVSVSVTYPGAAAAVVERDVTQIIEDNLSGIEDVELITSTTRDGFAQIDVEFELARDLDAAAADVRDKVAAVRQDLPDEIEEPVISKASADAQAIMWITLTSDELDRRALTDFAIRTLIDPLSIVPGVAQVIIGGERRYAMRIWLDTGRMAARSVTVQDVVNALRTENIEPPGGRLETGESELVIRLDTKLQDVPDFEELVVRTAGAGQIVLGDVAQVELGAESYRSAVYRNGEPAIGLGIVRQSGSNVLNVAGQVRAELERLAPLVPDDISLNISYDQSRFIEETIEGVLWTLAITALLVVIVIYLFLGSLKGTLVPAATIPASLLASFLVLYALGFSINTLTLLALVLAVGLVVDDAIVVLENVVRLREQGMGRLAAAVRGAGQVSLAVIATTAVLVAVLLPIAALTGTTGRLFTEFAITLSAALVFSSFLALTLGAALSSILASPAPQAGHGGPLRLISGALGWLERRYAAAAGALASASWLAVILAIGVGASGWFLFNRLPSELAPVEDRGAFIIVVQTPEGSGISRTARVVREIEGILAPWHGKDQPIRDIISIAGVGRQGPPQVNAAFMIVVLHPWAERSMSQQALVAKLTPVITGLPGAQAVPISPSGIVPETFGQPVQFVIGGIEYGIAFEWAQRVLRQAQEEGLIVGARLDFNLEQPRLNIEIRRRLAADLGISVSDVGETLRALFAEDDFTEFYRLGETYEVMLRARPSDRDEPSDLDSVFVRTEGGRMVPLAAITETSIVGSAPAYRRVDRQPAMVITGVPGPGKDLGAILSRLEEITREVSDGIARTTTLGQSRDFVESTGGIFLVFGLSIIVVYLTLAALYESFVYPLVILFAVPLAASGGLAALVLGGQSFNIFSQIALLLLIGLLAKNAVLVVDFANQRRQEGRELKEAVVEAARTRFRPVLMTSISTFFGGLPLLLATGAGSEARSVIGLVIMTGVLVATLITLLIVPGLYTLLARFTGIPGHRSRKVDEALGGAEGLRKD